MTISTGKHFNRFYFTGGSRYKESKTVSSGLFWRMEGTIALKMARVLFEMMADEIERSLW